LRKLDNRLDKVEALLGIPAVEGLREQQAQGKQKNIDYRTLYTDKSGPWWRHVSSGRQLAGWSDKVSGNCITNMANAPGKNTPTSVLTGEVQPLNDPPGSPETRVRMAPSQAPKDYLQFPLHGMLAIQDNKKEQLFVRATYFRALEDIGIDTDPDHAEDPDAVEELRWTARCLVLYPLLARP